MVSIKKRLMGNSSSNEASLEEQQKFTQAISKQAAKTEKLLRNMVLAMAIMNIIAFIPYCVGFGYTMEKITGGKDHEVLAIIFSVGLVFLLISLILGWVAWKYVDPENDLSIHMIGAKIASSKAENVQEHTNENTPGPIVGYPMQQQPTMQQMPHMEITTMQPQQQQPDQFFA